MMKKLNNNLLILALALCCSFVMISCNKEDNLSMSTEIVGLGGETTEQNEIDEWLYENYVKPYNIEVKYKWDQFELDLTATLVPPKEEVVIPLMSAIKKIWIEPYEAVAGSTFIKNLCPKKYVLVGSPRYNSSGTITTGEAEGGRKITIFRVNWYENSDKELLQTMVKTVHHEFAHTMHQTTMFPEEYMNITPGVYTSSWNNVSADEAMRNGCISPYACANPDEDFVEMISRICVYGKANFDNYVAQASAIYADPAQNEGMTYDPGVKLREKETIIVTYLKDVWGIDLYDPAPSVKGLETLVQEAIEAVTSASNPQEPGEEESNN